MPSCFSILVPFFTNHCWLNMTKTAWNWKIWWTFKPEGQPDPDWTQIRPWGPDPTPKVGSIWSYFLDFSLNPKFDPFFGQANPNLDPEGPTPPDLGPWYQCWPWQPYPNWVKGPTIKDISDFKAYLTQQFLHTFSYLSAIFCVTLKIFD